MRFNGVSQFLRNRISDALLQDFSIFIVAIPRPTPGAFPAFMAFNAKDQRDYVSRLNIDLGPSPQSQLAVINVEGKGMGGFQNLRRKSTPFNQLTILQIDSSSNESTRLTVDRAVEGFRKRQRDAISMEELTIGARYYGVLSAW